ncbi:MAG TPA: hypothetical protein VJA94_23430 [Candidatus Angelobacter sp.]
MKQVQGEDVVEKKYSEQGGSSFLFRSCFYRTAAFANSISLSLAVPAPAGKGAEGPREYWMKHFRDADTSADSQAVEHEKSEGKNEEEGERHSKPVEVKGIGEQAYWIANPRVGALYVLERNYFLRISVGGKGTDDLRSKKARDLARAALKRLKPGRSHTAGNLKAGTTGDSGRE